MPVEREAVLQRLRTAEGHLHAIRGMIEAGAPCQQILHQLDAVRCAIEAASSQFLYMEIEHCLHLIRDDPCPEQRCKAVERLTDLYSMMSKVNERTKRPQ